MENVLEVYARPKDEAIPLVCLDEFSKQLISEVSAPLAMTKKSQAKQDYEYVREGSVTSFIMALPHLGMRHLYTAPSGRRTAIDFAHCIDYLLSEVLPDAKKVVLVMDNFNTHSEASLYKAFAPAKARSFCERLEIHFTPKHGSWLNMAEIEIGKLVKTGLKERIPSRVEYDTQTDAYLRLSNQSPQAIKWQFTNEKARVKLRHLYPSF